MNKNKHENVTQFPVPHVPNKVKNINNSDAVIPFRSRNEYDYFGPAGSSEKMGELAMRGLSREVQAVNNWSWQENENGGKQPHVLYKEIQKHLEVLEKYADKKNLPEPVVETNDEFLFETMDDDRVIVIPFPGRN